MALFYNSAKIADVSSGTQDRIKEWLQKITKINEH